MQTKFSETVITTNDLKEMQDKYLAERLLRKWNEDFIDEDNGDVVTIERNEVIFEKGTFLDSNSLAEINFFLQSGAIENIKVSNQPRNGTLVSDHATVYVVTAEKLRKKTNYYLYAKSSSNAIEIATDFLEQMIVGSFSFSSVKKLPYSNLIPPNDDQELDETVPEPVEKYFYAIEMEVKYIDDDYDVVQSFILQATNVEDAKNTIESFIVSKLSEDNKDATIATAIISAKQINCENVIDYKFSAEYFEHQKEVE